MKVFLALLRRVDSLAPTVHFTSFSHHYYENDHYVSSRAKDMALNGHVVFLSRYLLVFNKRVDSEISSTCVTLRLSNETLS